MTMFGTAGKCFFALAPALAAAISTALPSAGNALAGQAARAYHKADARVVAQGFARPPGDIGEGGGGGYPAEPGQTDPSSLLVRMGRLESQIRQLNGQMEQMQFETRRLEEQLRKFQEDVDFRFRERAPGAPAGMAPQRRGDAIPEAQPGPELQGRAPGAAAMASQPGRRGDAFDPAQNPSAPGAPRPLGSAESSAPLGSGPLRHSEAAPPAPGQDEPGAPLDLTGALGRPPAPAGRAVPSPTPPGSAAASPAASGGTAMAALPHTPREEFEIAMAYLKQRSYENAEKGFARFLEKNPRDKLAPDAVYYLGESFYLRGRPREAAEQFLKIPAQYPSSVRAPEALLRLGQALSALGAKEQACATFSEIGRKYPNAPAGVKAGAERETRRAQCG